MIVNKRRPLNPIDFVPGDLVSVPVAATNPPQLRAPAADAVVRLFDAALAEAGLRLASNSAYRSYSLQRSIYEQEVASLGRSAADSQTARPGYSEHQTGLSIDIGASSGNCSLAPCFADTPEGRWLAGNAWRFGFVLRYPAGATAVTGYTFEPWHYRYVGQGIAAEMHNGAIPTLEQYFGLPAAPDY